jgi:hypothetical protein
VPITSSTIGMPIVMSIVDVIRKPLVTLIVNGI